MSSNDTYTYILREELTWAKARIAELEAQLEKLSGKTGYCTECERLGRENKELREVLKLSNHREHDWDDHGKCLCCQCEFVRGRDKALSGGG